MKRITIVACILLLMTNCIFTQNAYYKDVYFDPSKCIIHADTNCYFQNISVQYKDEQLFVAEPINKTARDFSPCSPDSSLFLVRGDMRRLYFDITKFSADSAYYISVNAVRNNDPQQISIHYSFDMSEIKSKTEMYRPKGIWMQ